jgi:hypothetical protein
MELLNVVLPNDHAPQWVVDLDQVVAAQLLPNSGSSGSVQLVLYIGTHELEFSDEQARAIWQRLQERAQTPPTPPAPHGNRAAVYAARTNDPASS